MSERSLLNDSEQESANNLCEDLAKYGIFIVRHGKVESWLSNLNVLRSKHTLLYSIFEKMGSTPNSSSYVKPEEEDV